MPGVVNYSSLGDFGDTLQAMLDGNISGSVLKSRGHIYANLRLSDINKKREELVYELLR